MRMMRQYSYGEPDPSAGYAFYYDPKNTVYRSGSTLSTTALYRNLLFTSRISAAWSRQNLTTTYNNVLAPDGTMTGTTIADDATNDWHIIYQAVESANSVRSGSIVAKAGTASFVTLFDYNSTNLGATFDLSNGTVTHQSNCTARTEDLGDGWYRCIVEEWSFILYFTIAMGTTAAQSRGAYVGTGSTILLWQADANNTETIQDMVVTTGTPLSAGGPADLPGYSYTRSGYKGEVNALSGTDRIDYFPANVPGEVPGVGYWARGAVTNLMTQSQAFDQWSLFGCPAPVANSATALDGTMTAEVIVEDTGGSGHCVYRTVTTTAATHTVSVFVKKGTRRYASIRGTTGAAGNAWTTIDLDTGALQSNASVAAAYAIDCGSGWWRLVMVYNNATTAGNDHVLALSDVATAPDTANNTGNAYIGTGATIHARDFQVMLGNFPDGGPIIPTAGATQALGADQMILTDTMTALADADTLFYGTINIPAFVGGNKGLIQWDDGTDNNRVVLWFDGVTARATVTAGGVSQLAIGAGVYTANTDITLVCRRMSGNWRFGTIEAGVLTWAAAASAGSMPTGIDSARPGEVNVGGGNAPNAIIRRGAVKVATFATDAEIIAAVA